MTEKNNLQSRDLLPEQFKVRMKALLGKEYPEFLASYERERCPGLRINTLKISLEDWKAANPFALRSIPWTEDGFYYKREERPGKHPYHDAGLYYIQEPSAMAVVNLCLPQPGQRVLDLCAAPGGKTAQLAAAMKGEGILFANEIHPARAKILSQNIERMGISNAIVTNEDPRTLAEYFPHWFDYILVDAPCSGEGMFLKEEQACSQWSTENVSMCAGRQQEILKTAASMLKEGGTLLYSTCTFSPEENEGTIQAFLAAHPEFSLQKTESNIGRFFSPGRPEWVCARKEKKPATCGSGKGVNAELEYCYRLWPHRLSGEGHFAAILKKQSDLNSSCKIGNETAAQSKANKKQQRGKKSNPFPDKAAMALWQEFADQNLNKVPAGIPILFGEQLYLLPCECPLRGLKVVRPGLHLGTCKKNRFEPAHALALWLPKEDAKRVICLSVSGAGQLSSSTADAEAYLRGETLSVSGEKGWYLVLAGDFPIGWGKLADGILKNHYPKGLRWV